MKKLVFFLVALAAAPQLSRAQDQSAGSAPASASPAPAAGATPGTAPSTDDQGQDVRFGIKLTGGIAKVVGANASSDASNRASFGGGVMANILLTDESLSVQPELLYVVKGYKQDLSTGSYDLKLRYITLPVMVRFKRQGFFVEGGPQLSYLLSANQNSPTQNNDKARTAFNEVDWGLAGGLGYELPNGVSLAARYNGSINSIFPNKNNARVKVFNSLIELHLGFLLPKGN